MMKKSYNSFILRVGNRASQPDNKTGPEKTRQPDEQTNPWEKAMKDVPSYSEHIAKIEQATKPYDNTANEWRNSRIQRAINKTGISESRSNELQFEEDLSKLEPKDALRLLTYINGVITGNKKHERRTLGYGVWGGAEVSGHLSPAPDVQEIAIEETVNAIQNDIKDNHKRAALSYYMINHLHLFSDGNGRTARAVYEVFDEEDFRVVGNDFMHQTDSDEEIGSTRKDFIEKRGLMPDREVSNMIFGLVKDDLAEESKLPKEMLESGYGLNLPNSNRPMPDVYLTDDAEKNLTFMEKKIVRHAFFEKSLATIALGIMLQRKKNFRWAASEGTKEGVSGEKLFEIEKKDAAKAKEVFWSWNADDYREYCNVLKDLQLQQARKLIDVFKNEGKYKTPDGRTYAEVMSRK